MERVETDYLESKEAFKVFCENKTTMREGLIRVLEQMIDPARLAFEVVKE